MGQIGPKCANGVLSSRSKWSHFNVIFPPVGIAVYFKVCKSLFLSKNVGQNGPLTISGHLGNVFYVFMTETKNTTLRGVHKRKLPAQKMVWGDIN